jgi:hypothetical protein
MISAESEGQERVMALPKIENCARRKYLMVGSTARKVTGWRKRIS